MAGAVKLVHQLKHVAAALAVCIAIYETTRMQTNHSWKNSAESGLLTTFAVFSIAFRLKSPAGQGSRPRTSSSPPVPTYTFPFMIVGTEKVIPRPRRSRSPAWCELYSSWETFVAS